jgi:hypothetical protein
LFRSPGWRTGLDRPVWSYTQPASRRSLQIPTKPVTDVATLHKAAIVVRPVLNPMRSLRDMVAPGLMELERQANLELLQSRNVYLGMAILAPTPP